MWKYTGKKECLFDIWGSANNEYDCVSAEDYTTTGECVAFRISLTSTTIIPVYTYNRQHDMIYSIAISIVFLCCLFLSYVIIDYIN